MQLFLDIVNILGVIGVWVFVFWFGASIKNLKSISDSLNGVFSSMKSSSEYLANIQSTAQKLYDPKEIEKVVTLQVKAKELEFKNSIKKLKEEAKQEQEEQLQLNNQKAAEKTRALAEQLTTIVETKVEPYMTFAAYAYFDLSSEQLEDILEQFEDEKISKEIRGFLGTMKKKVDEKIASRTRS